MTLSANFTSKSVFDMQGCRTLTFALARFSCIHAAIEWRLIVTFPVQAEQERLKETLKAQEEAIREAITKDKQTSRERFVL